MPSFQVVFTMEVTIRVKLYPVVAAYIYMKQNLHF